MEPKKNPKYDVHKKSNMIFFFSLCLSILLVLTAFQWKHPISKPYIYSPVEDVIVETIYPIPITEITDRLPAKPTPVREKPVVINPIEVESLDLPRIEIPVEIPALPVEIPTEFTKPLENIDTFMIVEKMPLPKGGYEGFYKFLSTQTKYPNAAIRSQTEGNVFVEFVVNKKGELTNMRVTKGIGYGCDEEAIRVVALTKWEAGKQRGIPVNVKMTVPIRFDLR